MKKYLLPALLLPFLAFSQVPAGYYNGTAGLTGFALKSKLHEIISQKVYSYNYSRIPDFYPQTDADNYYENNGSLLDIYSENPVGTETEYNFTQLVGSASGEGTGFNREHGMPQSTYYGVYPMYSDFHYLIPADAWINQRRSNYPYARNNGNNTIFSNGSKLGNSTTPGYSNLVYEPINEFKGDVARYLLYFVTRYEGSLNVFNHMLTVSPLDGSEEKGYENWYITMLLDWHNLDPVSQKEIDRNNAVYNIQKIRNPFVDNPAWVTSIWGTAADTVAPQAPTALTVTETGESYVKLSWQPSPDADVLGYNIYVDGVLSGYSKTNTYFLDRLAPSSTRNISVKAYDAGYLLSPDSNLVSASTLASDALARDLMITKYIEGTTSSTNGVYNNAIEITNKTGHPVNLNNYHLSIQFKGSGTTYYFSDSYMLEGTIQPGESKVIINPDASFASYAVNSADVVTSAPPLTYSGSHYIELSYATKYLKTASTNNYDLSYTTVDAVGFKDTTNTLGNISLYRNANVTDPNVNFTISEWTQHPINYTVGLGEDLVLNTQQVFASSGLKVYPNPVKDGIIYVSGTDLNRIKSASILDMSGRMVLDLKNPFRNGDAIDVSALTTGNYILKLDQQVFKIVKK